MKKLIIIAVVLLLCTSSVFAANIEMLDEMTLGAKISAPSIILKSDHINIGAEIGAFDLSSGDSAKGSFYAMGVITIKGWSLFDWSTE